MEQWSLGSVEKLQPETKPRCQSGFDVRFWLVARKEANLAPETNLSIAPTCYNHHNAMVYAYMALETRVQRGSSLQICMTMIAIDMSYGKY
jgi:hypothetical protein